MTYYQHITVAVIKVNLLKALRATGADLLTLPLLPSLSAPLSSLSIYKLLHRIITLQAVKSVREVMLNVTVHWID